MTEPDDTYGDEALAAEYVLRLLDADARRSFEARLAEDQALRALVTEWEMRLAQIADDVAPVAPPARIKAATLAAMAGTQAAHGFGIMRSWAWLLGGIAVAGLAAFFLVSTFLVTEPDMSPAFRAELSSQDQSIVLVASVIPATHEIVVDPVSGTPPDGRIFELWLIAEGATAPISLGVLDSESTTRIRVPDDIAPSVRTGTIAISDEPPGGSPTGAPTGTVLATATFTDI